MWQNSLSKYLNDLNKSKLKSQFNSIKSDYKRIEFCVKNKIFKDNDLNELNSEYSANKCAKNKDTSLKHRELGNNFYKKKQFQDAFNNYLLAIVYAPVNSEQLALSFANRSAVFYELKFYEQCLNDIKQVTSLDRKYPNELLFKLIYRKSCCLFHLNRVDEFKQSKIEFFESIKSLNLKNKSENDKLEGLKRDLEEKFNDLNRKYDLKKEESVTKSESSERILFKNTNPKYPHMIDLINVEYTNENGRYCVANSTRDIEIGEILFHEKAYCAILLPEFSLDYCEYCFKRLKNKYSGYNYTNIHVCDCCTDVYYCSLECKLNAFNTYHKHECSMLPLLHDLGIAHLAYRIVSSTDINILLKYSSKDEVSLGDYYSEFMKNGSKTFLSSDYDSVYHMVTNSNSTHVDDLFQYSLTSILLAKYYFKSVDCSKYGDSESLLISVASLLLRHIQQTICNAHAMTKMNENDENSSLTYDYDQVRYATAIYPTVSLMNHSCDPSVICSFIEDTNEIVIKSVKKIEKNEHVWNCYGPHYLKMGDMERRLALEEQYHFTCKCKYCSRLDNLNGQKFAFKCLKCERLELASESNTIKCTKCAHETTFDEYYKIITEIRTLFSGLSRDKHVDSNVSIQVLKKCLNLFNNVLLCNLKDIERLKEYLIENSDTNKMFYVDYCKILDKLARVLCENGDYDKGSKYLDKSIELLKLVYNQENCIEIALELFKLAEILSNCRQFNLALTKLNEAIAIAEANFNNNNEIVKEFYKLKDDIELAIKCN